MQTVTYTGRAGARVLTINGLDVTFYPGHPVELGDAEADKLQALAPGEFRTVPVEPTRADTQPAKPVKPARATGKAK